MKANNFSQILFLLCCTISSSALFAQKDKTKYFEGEVIYDIEYISKTDLFTNDQLKEKFGSKIVYTFKEGSSIRKYFSPSGSLLKENAVDMKLCRFYAKKSNSDTIRWYNGNAQETESEYFTLNDSTINGYNCKRIFTQGITYDLVNEKEVKYKNYYAYGTELPINPQWFINFNAAHLNKIIAYAKGILVESREDMIDWVMIIKIKTAKRRKVKDKELKIKIEDEHFLKEIK